MHMKTQDEAREEMKRYALEGGDLKLGHVSFDFGHSLEYPHRAQSGWINILCGKRETDCLVRGTMHLYSSLTTIPLARKVVLKCSNFNAA